MKLIISSVSGEPIYEQIKNQIRSAVMSGELEAGEALPSLRKLAKELHPDRNKDNPKAAEKFSDVTKAYDLLLGEGLWYEMKKHKVDVLTLCPGATQTEFANVADTGPVPGSMPAGPVVKAALEALGNKPVVVAGFKNKLMVFGSRLVSRRIGTLIAAQVMKKLGRS